MSNRRICTGIIHEFYAERWGEEMDASAIATINGIEFSVPVTQLNNAGYSTLEVGGSFRVDWPVGIIPRTMGILLPPIEKVEEV